MNTTNLNTPTDINDLLTLMAGGNYKNLKVFLYTSNRSDLRLPMDFLCVSSTGFGRVTVNQVDYCNQCVTVDITDASTGHPKTLCIDIDQKPDFMMVNWKSLVDMVRDDQSSCSGSDELLEFGF